VTTTPRSDITPRTNASAFGTRVSYGRLREACQTEVDGTSIDTVEEVANRLGLEAEQIMIPADHLLVPGANALPAIVVVTLPNGLTHFVVAWRRHGNMLQVMDPAVGRRWAAAISRGRSGECKSVRSLGVRGGGLHHHPGRAGRCGGHCRRG